MAELTLNAVLAMQTPERTTQKRTFKIAGQDYEIELGGSADGSAEEFFESVEAMTSADSGPVEIAMPTGKRFKLKSEKYRKLLRLLASLSVSPQFGFDEWAILGHQAGVSTMNDIFAFACEVNGIDPKGLETNSNPKEQDKKQARSRSRSKTPA